MGYNSGMRKSREELKEMYNRLKDKVVVGGFYAHFKSHDEKTYQVVGIGLMEDTWQPLVMYEHVASGVRTVRTLENFLEKIEIDGAKTFRFVFLGNE